MICKSLRSCINFLYEIKFKNNELNLIALQKNFDLNNIVQRNCQSLIKLSNHFQGEDTMKSIVNIGNIDQILVDIDNNII